MKVRTLIIMCFFLQLAAVETLSPQGMMIRRAAVPSEVEHCLTALVCRAMYTRAREH